METAVGLITTNYSVKHPSALTKSRPAASVPFLGRYRFVDFALSNMVNAGINTVGDLINKSEDDMMKVRNLGRKSLEEVMAKLDSLGFMLTKDDDN